MSLPIILVLIYINLCLSEQNECICACCLDDNINCMPTFRSGININPLLKCNNITCNQETCLTFSQCSIAFGKVVASCQNVRSFPSSGTQTIFPSVFLILLIRFCIRIL